METNGHLMGPFDRDGLVTVDISGWDRNKHTLDEFLSFFGLELVELGGFSPFYLMEKFKDEYVITRRINGTTATKVTARDDT